MNRVEQLPTAPVAIIGLGCLFPGAADVESYWANIVNRVDAVGDIPATHWRAEDYFHADPGSADLTYAKRGGFLSPVDFPLLDFGIAPNSLEAVDSTQLLGLLVASRALEDAGYAAGKPFDRHRASVILGVTGTLPLVIPLGARLGHPHWRQALAAAGIAEADAERVVQRIADHYVPWQESSFPGLLGNVVAGRIANRLDLGGTNCVVDAACASSLSALHLGLCELTSGRTDMVLTGGMDCFNDIFMYVCFSKTQALSRSGHAKPFDSSGDGTTLGEGLGCLVLKRLADAERDGDKIYAVIRGVGTSSDGKGQAIYAPSASGQVRALRQAYELAGVTPQTVELVEAHGTGTRAGDTAEVAALNEVYGAATTGRCALGSVKSQIGHTKAAAGAAGLIKVALALHHKVLPPTIHVTQPIDPLLPGRSPFYVNTEARPWMKRPEHPRRAGVSSFGFGGSNFHCVLEEYHSEKRDIAWDGATQIVALAAESADALQRAAARWPAADEATAASTAAHSWDEIRIAAARSREAFSPDAHCRLVAVLEKDTADQNRPLARAAELVTKRAGQSFWTTPDGVVFGSGRAAGGLAMLFPGQGSQYVGMLRELACVFPQMLTALGDADRAFVESGSDRRLTDVVYPLPVFAADEMAANETALRAVDIAQPAIGAVSVGALSVLAHFGVRPDATAGHSYGELVALHAAGRLDAASLHRLSQLRGRLMADRAGDPGSMLAVRASVATVEEITRAHAIDLFIANRNAPQQTVLSGKSSEIQRAAGVFAQAGIRSTPLAVAAAFHTPFVAHASERFAAALEEVEIHTGNVPVFSNTTGDVYPMDPTQAKALLAGQLARPVAFSDQIVRLYERDIRTFVEVGPGHTLTGLVDAILDGRNHAAIALDGSSGKRSGVGDLARALARLAGLGYGVALHHWDPPGEARTQPAKRTGMTVSICGANYVRPKPASSQREETAQALTTAEPPLLTEALRATQENLAALQKLGEQTARLHAQFLENQNRTLEVFQALMGQQQRMLQGGVPLSPVLSPESAAPTVAQAALPATPPLPSFSPDPGPAAVYTPPSARGGEIAAPSVSVSEAPHVDPKVVADTLVAIVAEKTGYPADVLRLDMELDADLGIDSIKRVEIFSAFQEQLPDTPAVTSQHLGSLRTLQHVVDFYTRHTESVVRAAPPTPAAGNGKRYVLRQKALAADAVRSPLAIDPSAEIWVTADDVGLAERIVVQLREAGYDSRLVDLHREEWQAPPAGLAGLVVVAPREPSGDDLLRDAFVLMQYSGAALGTCARAGGALFCTVARLDGAFGLSGVGTLANPASAGFSGLVKTAALEWPAVHCKALDVSGDVERDTAAAAIVEEMLLDGPLEVGIAPGSRCRLELVDEPHGPIAAGITPADPEPPARLQRGDVVVVSGGARGVTAEIAVVLAQACGASLVLLGRSPQPRTEPDWLAPLTEESEIRKALAVRAGEHVTPRELDEEYRRVMANREIGRTLERVRAAGATAQYHSVDVRDEDAVGTVLAGVRASLGPVRAIVHGAGVLADRAIDRKTRAEFDHVYSTKVAGLRALLAHVNTDELKLLALCSSLTARVGRAGQADYAAANEVLNKTAQQLASRWRHCRVISFNWGPWDGGMVTPSLKRMFHAEGMDVLALHDGAAFFLREISGHARDVEVVPLAGEAPPPGTAPPRPRPAADDRLMLSFEREVTVERFPVLRAHVLAQRPVVPTALVLEWLAHGALHRHPGFAFHGFDDLRVLKGLRLNGSGAYRIRILAGKGATQDSAFRVPVELHGLGDDGTSALHARATIVLSSDWPDPPVSPPLFCAPYRRDVTAIYRDLLFHGPELQGIVDVEGLSEEGGVAAVASAPTPAAWIQQPLRSAWLADPLVLDSGFQLMTLWSHERCGAFSLPTFVGQYRQFRRAFPRNVRVLARITQRHPHRVVADLWFVDDGGVTVACMTGYECVIDQSLGQAFRENRLQARALPSS